MENFQQAMKDLEKNPQKVIEECEDFRDSVIDWLRKQVREAEKGVRGTPKVNLRLMGTSECDHVIKLIAYSIAIWDRENTQRPKINLDGELGEAVGDYLRDEDLFETPGGRYSPRLSFLSILNTGIINTRECRVSVFYLPEKIRNDVDFSRCPAILRPLFDDMIYHDDDFASKISPLELFHGLILHEMTHAYISGHLGGNWSSKYNTEYNPTIDDEHKLDLEIKSLDEGACQAVSSLFRPAQTINIESYQIKHGMADLQFFKTCFLIYAERFEKKKEKVSKIRERAVKAVKRIYKTQKRKSGFYDYTNLPFFKEYTIVSAVLDDHDQKLEAFRMILKKLEKAEKKAFFSLSLLNMLEYDIDNHMRSFISEIEREADNTVHQLASQDGSITQIFPEQPEYRVYDPDVGEYGETNVKHEFDDSLYEIRSGLQHLLAIAENNEKLSNAEENQIKSAVEDVEEAIEIFKREGKLENSLESELNREYEEDTEKIADWIKERVEQGDYADPVRVLSDLEVETKALLKDYLRVVDAGIEYNSKIKKRLEALHHDEEGIRQTLDKNGIQVDNVEEMMRLTRHIYNLCIESNDKLKEAKDTLKSAQENLNEISA